MNKLQAKFQTAAKELKASLVRRDGEVDLLLTAMLARKNPLLVGPPGCAKSLTVDNLCKWLSTPAFSYLLTKFTDPMEIFGPINLEKLKQGSYERIVDGYLPTATIFFADECFKASSAILNTFLKILNERVFVFGKQEVKCPLLMGVGASNEYPNEQNGGQELGALFDRFLLRKTVKALQGKDVDELLRRKDDNLSFEPVFSDTATPEEVNAAAEFTKHVIKVPQETVEARKEILQELKRNGIFPSNRRVAESSDVLKAYTFLKGADQVEVEHLEILSCVLWDAPEQEEKTYKIVMGIANSLAAEILKIQEDVESMYAKAEEDIKNEPDQSKKSGIAAATLKRIDMTGKELKNKRQSELGDQLLAELREARVEWAYRAFNSERN